MRVVCAFTRGRLRRGTVEALVAQAPEAEFRDVGSAPDAYFELFRELWRDGRDFVLVEHDVVIADGAIASFEGCAEAWCSAPMGESQHPHKGSVDAWFQCNRWRPTVLPVPDLDLPMLERHWGQMDSFVIRRFEAAGFPKPHPHLGHRTFHLSPSVGHSQNHGERKEWEKRFGPRPRNAGLGREVGVDWDTWMYERGLLNPSTEEGDGVELLEGRG